MNRVSKDRYIRDEILRGDEGSKRLRAITAPTLENNDMIRIAGNDNDVFPVIDLGKSNNNIAVITRSTSYSPSSKDCGINATLDELAWMFGKINGTPIGIGNVVDSNTGELEMIDRVGEHLLLAANRHNIGVMNGENAILGDVIQDESIPNLTITMIGSVPSYVSSGIQVNPGYKVAVFDPQGKAVYVNCDGVGTKTLVHARWEELFPGKGLEKALSDSGAMRFDDTVKIAASPRVDSSVVEYNGFSRERIRELVANGARIGPVKSADGFILKILEMAQSDNLAGYKTGAPGFNISGSTVSTIDEDRLQNLPRPKEGDYLLLIRSKEPNIRSNGVTRRREIPQNIWGVDWHNEVEAREVLEYLSRPSTILFEAFDELLRGDVASSVYHMSGGAFNGKLAKPLAKEGLFAKMVYGIPEPPEMDVFMQRQGGISTEDVYEMWPMGCEGFVSTSSPDRATEILAKHGLEAKKVAILYRDEKLSGVSFTAYDGTPIYYSGK